MQRRSGDSRMADTGVATATQPRPRALQVDPEGYGPGSAPGDVSRIHTDPFALLTSAGVQRVSDAGTSR